MTQARDHRPRALAALCVTEIVSWGVLYYAFPVLVGTLTTDTGWSATAAVGAFSLGAVVSAVAGVWVGRLIDRLGPRPVMTTGSVVGVASVLAVAAAPTLPWFYAAWALAGVAQAATFYPPAFAAVTGWFAEGRVRALTTLTLVAGFSSTVFAPLTAALLAHLQWRQSYLVLAVVLGAITIPAHLLGLRGRWPDPDLADQLPAHVERAPDAIARSRSFLFLVAAITLGTFVAFAVVVNQVPLLIERGLSTSVAAWALGLGGIGQVLGRLGYGRLTRATSVRTRSVVILALAAAATALLAVLPGPTALLIAAAMFAGAVRGVFTLLQATAISDRWGATHYGRLNGLLSAPALLATALAPWAGAALAQSLGSYPAVFLVLAGIAGLAAALATGSTPDSSHSRP